MWDLGVDPVALNVDPEGYDGPRSRAQPFFHRSGWLRLAVARFEMPFITWRRTLIACVTDHGEVLTPGVACRLFAMPISSVHPAEEHPPAELEEVIADLYADFLGRTDQDNLLYLEEANEQADAKLRRFEARGAALQRKVEAATRQLRAARRRPEATAEQRDLIDLKLSRLSTASDELAAEARRRAQGAREATNELEAAILRALRRLGTVEDRMTVRWRARSSGTVRIAPLHWQEEAWCADAWRERRTSPVVVGWGVPGRSEF